MKPPPRDGSGKRLAPIPLLAGLLLVVGSSPSFGRDPQPRSSPRLVGIVILSEGLTLDDLEDQQYPSLFTFARDGRIALMSAPVAGNKTDTAAALVLASGLPGLAEASDEEAYGIREIHPEGDNAADVFRRRTGQAVPPVHGSDPLFPSAGPAVHLGIASLARRGLNNRLLASLLAPRRIAVGGNADTDLPGRRAALFGMTAEGGIERANLGRGALELASNFPYGIRDTPERLAAWALTRANSDLVVLQLGDLARADSKRAALTEEDYRSARTRAIRGVDRLLSSLSFRSHAAGLSPRILLVSPRPAPDRDGSWNRLSVLVLGRPGVRELAGTLTSATTRTAGLVCNFDVAPTLLAWFGIAQPARLSGHPISPGSASRADLHRIDQLTQANARGIDTVFIGLGIAAAVVGFGGLLAVRLGRQPIPCSLLMLVLSNFPLAMLLNVLLAPRSVAELVGYTWAIILALGVLEALAGLMIHRFRKSVSSWRGAILLLTLFTSGAILVDGILGQERIKYSVFSSYQLSGIRFYGIGNEYMGVLIGMSLLFVFLTEMRALPASCLFVVCALVLGLPPFGANAGGLIAAVVAFGAAFLILKGGRASWKAVLILVAAGFAAAFLLALADRAVSGTGSTHFGGAIRSAGEQGWGAILALIERKVRMNAAILMKPATLVALAGVAAVIVCVRGILQARLRRLGELNPGWARGLPAAGWGSLAAFLFNDSGAVPAIFILGSFLASGMILLFSLPPNATIAED